MAMKNLTGVPQLFPDSGLVRENQEQLSEEEKLKRKRALFAGSQSANPNSFLFPRMSALGTPMV